MNRAFGCVVAFVATLMLSGSAITAQSRAPIVSTLDIQTGAPPAIVAVAGRQHLVYELHITNFRRADVTLTRVEVIDTSRNALLGELSDAALSSRIARVGAPDAADKRLIPAGMRAVIYLWLPVERGARVPPRIRHRIAVTVSGARGSTPLVVSSAEVGVRTDRPLALAPPLRGGPWVALYDPLLIGGHRTAIYAVDGRARIPARFAIDFVRLERDGSHALGDRSQIANWHGYGAEVLAVADATVVEAMDDIPEAPSIAAAQGPIPLENVGGNYVSLDLGAGRYAFYEHLKHGSIRVRAGDRVKAGDVIGVLGNSGSSSSGPHLHFHVADASAELAADGLPYVFAGFERIGGFDTIGGFRTGELWTPASDDEGGSRENELPSPNSVIMFPGGRGPAPARSPGH